MKRYWPLVIGLFCGVGLSLLIIHQARADDGVPPPSPADCAPVVLNQYGASDTAGSADGVSGSGNASDSIVSISWGDANGDGNTGDEIITTLTPVGYTSTGQPLYQSSQTVVLAEWSMTCIVQQTCTGGDTSGGSGGPGGNGDCDTGTTGNGGGNCGTPGPCDTGSGMSGNGNCTTPGPCGTDMSGGGSGGNSNCNPPTPCPNGSNMGSGSGGTGGGCNNTTSPNASTGPSWSVNPNLDTPPNCALIQVTEYGMKCYPTCTTTTTEGGVACLGVQREPYPRGLVGVPNVYIVNGPFSKEGNTAVCPDPDLQYPLYRNRSLKVVWEMDLSIPPAWAFDERGWNIVKGVSNTAFGLEVEHTFETSSYPTSPGDKPYVGPSTTNELLPAYMVRVDTWWKGYIVREWDQYYWDEKREQYSCDPKQLNSDGSKADPNCGDDGIGTRLISREYKFQGHMTSKDQIDLSSWGWPTAELFSQNAWDPRQSVVGIPSQYICRYIPTPILEAQSVLTTGSGGNGP